MKQKNKNKVQPFDNNLNQGDYEYSKQLDETYLNDFELEDDTTHFTEQDYANLQRNLVLFKEGDREATEYIIAAFHRILHAYTHFIVLHHLPYRKVYNRNGRRLQIHPSVRSFIAMFAPSQAKSDKESIRISCERIYSLFKSYEYGDIYNELVLALLNMANKYKIITDPNDPRYKPNGTFHVYVKKCFHFEAYHFLKQLIKDPIMNINIVSFMQDENEAGDICSFESVIDENTLLQYNTVIDCIDRQIALQSTNLLTIKEDEIDVFDDNSLNFNWINGVVCGPLFKSLTPYERELLLLAYTKNQTEDTLANLFNCSRSTIGSHKRKAIEKIKESMKDNKQ
jgi:hypothetical protein